MKDVYGLKRGRTRGIAACLLPYGVQPMRKGKRPLVRGNGHEEARPSVLEYCVQQKSMLPSPVLGGKGFAFQSLVGRTLRASSGSYGAARHLPYPQVVMKMQELVIYAIVDFLRVHFHHVSYLGTQSRLPTVHVSSAPRSERKQVWPEGTFDARSLFEIVNVHSLPCLIDRSRTCTKLM